MSWSGLETMETFQTLVCLACLLIAAITHNDALATRRRVLKSANHADHVWALINVRGKRCLVLVQVLSVAMGLDRLRLLINGYHPDIIVRFITFGLARMSMSVLVAWTAWMNMRGFQALRDEAGE